MASPAERMRKWRAEHPEVAKARRCASMRKWREHNIQTHYDRNKRWRDKWSGIPEEVFHDKVRQEMNLFSLDELKPDFYDQDRRSFIEIKRALPFRVCAWTGESKYFPGLYFLRVREFRHTASVDEQIDKYPRPLLVIVFHALEGNELARMEFPTIWDYTPIPWPIYPIVPIIPTVPDPWPWWVGPTCSTVSYEWHPHQI